jgi:flagellar hook assembly protein FlgD
VPARIAALAWRSAWPNPFDRLTRVKLAVPRESQGVVGVYDVQGKRVALLAQGHFKPGERTIEWDGRDASGGLAAPGLYFVSAEIGGESTRLRVARVP